MISSYFGNIFIYIYLHFKIDELPYQKKVHQKSTFFAVPFWVHELFKVKNKLFMSTWQHRGDKNRYMNYVKSKKVRVSQ